LRDLLLLAWLFAQNPAWIALQEQVTSCIYLSVYMNRLCGVDTNLSRSPLFPLPTGPVHYCSTIATVKAIKEAVIFFRNRLEIVVVAEAFCFFS